MKVRDVLTPDPPTALPSDTATSAWERMQSLDIHHLVVLRDGKVVGLVARRDLGGPAGGAHRRMGRTLADLMQVGPPTVTPQASVARAAGLLRRHRADCLPVIDRQRLVGMVTAWDLLALVEKPARG